MLIGGFQKVSLLDFPGKITAVVFTVGCNFRCGYCHNPELFYACTSGKISQDEIFSFLDKRKGKLDALTITGGEPTLQEDLAVFIKKIKEMGYLVKLDTNGSHPEILYNLLQDNLLDFIAMDIKAGFLKYQEIVRREIDLTKIKKSIDLIINSGVNYEFRTTVVESELEFSDLIQTAEMIKGAKTYALQKFIPNKVYDQTFLSKKSYSDLDFEIIKDKIKDYVGEVVLR